MINFIKDSIIDIETNRYWGVHLNTISGVLNLDLDTVYTTWSQAFTPWPSYSCYDNTGKDTQGYLEYYKGNIIWAVCLYVDSNIELTWKKVVCVYVSLVIDKTHVN